MNVLRTGVGDATVIVERMDVFFLIDKGSMLGGSAPLAACLGVVSIFPVGRSG